MKKQIKYIILSRTDSIGDMILTLPMAKALKENLQNISVYFLGKEYTRDVVNACAYSDGFIEMNDFLNTIKLTFNADETAIIHVKPQKKIAAKAKQLNIKKRIGTTNRLYHWTSCNKLVRLSRRKSNLHEAQLNLKLLAPFGIKKVFDLNEIDELYGFTRYQPLQKEFAALISKSKYNLILHPKSRGNAREWPLENYIELINLLNADQFNIFISGVDADKQFTHPLFNKINKRVTDIQGAMPLSQFISFIAACDGLVACSTGPLHIAAAAGINAYGIYPPIKPLHAGRWGPIGKKASVFTLDKECNLCKNNSNSCVCIQSISTATILNVINKHAGIKFNKQLQ